MCVVGVCCLFWESANSTVIDRELTPWFFWSVASGDFTGVLLKSCDGDGYGMDRCFFTGKDVALEGQLCFMDHPELDWLYLAFIAAGFELCLACG